MPRGGGTANKHAHFRDLVEHLPARSLLVLNDTRVLAARLHARKPTGGLVELLLTRSVSATPTAGLHFTEERLAELRARGHELATVTLHVGPGTFRPVKTEDPRARSSASRSSVKCSPAVGAATAPGALA